MLSHLVIKNYALIKHLEISPVKELNIITGETGAGKSIMLGAIGLLLGNRADTKVLFDENEKCVIEGTFHTGGYNLKGFFEEVDIEYDDECIVRREISATGKSRAFINDTPVNLEILKKWGNSLVDIHSQHETLLLGSAQYQIAVVDAFARNKKIADSYQEAFKEYKSAQAEYETITKRAIDEKKQVDYNSYLLNELLEASLEEGEQEKRETTLKVLENSEFIKSKLTAVEGLLSGDGGDNTIAKLQEAKKFLDSISAFSPNYETLKERLSSALIELKDIAGEIESENELVDHDAAAIEEHQSRLSLLYTLQKKHQVTTVEELLSIQKELEEKMNFAVNLDEKIGELKKQVEKSYKQVLATGENLSESRKKVVEPIKKELETLLREVGMPNATINIEQKAIEPSANGLDYISILFSANKGVPPQELKNAASGGEFSRLMLCVKYILADKTSLPTIIFDEIDTGISGEVAIKVGKMMKQMSRNHQVISISHLPQIAALGSAHYYVYKDTSSEKTISKMKLLTQEERVKEIAQMIGGEKPSETAIKSAQELLEL